MAVKATYRVIDEARNVYTTIKASSMQEAEIQAERWGYDDFVRRDGNDIVIETYGRAKS